MSNKVVMWVCTGHLRTKQTVKAVSETQKKLYMRNLKTIYDAYCEERQSLGIKQGFLI